MLKYKDNTLKLLSEYSNPASKFRDSTANPFSTDIEENRAYFGTEVILGDPISLIEELLLPIVKMINNLRKYMLLLTNLMSLKFRLSKLSIIFWIILPLRNNY